MDWYRERADRMTEQVRELMSSDEYLDMMAIGDNCIELIKQWRSEAESEPKQIGLYESSVDLLLSAYGMVEGLPEAAVRRLEQMAGTSAFSLANGQKGVDYLVASSTLTINEFFLMPDGFEPCIVLYEYDGFCIGVCFYRGSDEVVVAMATVVPTEVKRFVLKKGAEAGVQAEFELNDGIQEGMLDDRTELRDVLSGMGGGKRGK